jgi:glycosidase
LRRSILTALMVLFLAGCVAKRQPVRLVQPLTAAVVVVLDSEEERSVLETPESLRVAVAEELAARNLSVTHVPVADVVEGFQRLRATPHRLAHLGERAPEADVLVLVETRARFESRLQGARRWTVSARITIARSDARDLPSQVDLEAPVFLRFEFEQADEALRDATPAITKRLGRVADELIEGLTTQAPAAPEPPKNGTHSAPGDVVYFVMVDRFADGIPDAAGTVDRDDPQAFHGGDLPGLIDRLDYLKELGVGTVWLSPVFAMRDAKVGEHGAFHGYWTRDPYAIEPRFGSTEDLRRLSDELHRRGMKLYLDFVANHVGYDAPLLAEHPDWFHGLGDIESWDDPLEATTHDVHGLPDLAHEKPEVREWLIEAGLAWIDAVQPDGFRLDAVRHVPLDFWAEFNDTMRAAAGPDFVLLGEMFDGNPGTLADVARRGGFSHLFDFPLHYAIVESICGDAPLAKLAAALTSDWATRGGVEPVTFVDNHDLPRLLSACGGDIARAELALDVLLTARGTPCITWGTEAGAAGAGEPANRAFMDWSDHPLGSGLREAIARRSSHSVLGRGTTQVLELAHGSLVLQRGSGPDAVRVDIRKDARALTVAPTNRTAESVPVAAAWMVEAPGAVQLLAVGAGRDLGDWDPEHGLSFERTTRGFEAIADFPPGVVLEYKLVTRQADGSFHWEDRANRYLLVTPGVSANLTWGA